MGESGIWDTSTLAGRLSSLRWIFGGGADLKSASAGLYREKLFMASIDSLTTEYCRRDDAFDLRKKACDKPLRTLKEKTICATARSSFVSSDQCSGHAQDNVIKCNAVCSHNIYHWSRIQVSTDFICALAVVLVGLIFCTRLCRGVQHIRHARKSSHCVLRQAECERRW